MKKRIKRKMMNMRRMLKLLKLKIKQRWIKLEKYLLLLNKRILGLKLNNLFEIIYIKSVNDKAWELFNASESDLLSD